MNTNRTNEAVWDSSRHVLRDILVRLPVLFIWLSALHAAAMTYYVDINSTNPTPPYTNWNTAATKIQDAINVSSVGDLVLVADGTYFEASTNAGIGNTVSLNQAITVESVNGPATTIIRGQPYLPPPYGLARGAYLAAGATLIGFTVTAGYSYNGGGGVYCQSSSSVLSNCVVTGNIEKVDGGGGVWGGTLYNCTINNNSGGESGGGVSGATLYNCTVSGNTAAGNGSSIPGYGGGVCNCICSNCTLGDNSAEYIGGGAYNSTLNNCLVTGNNSNGGPGGGVCVCLCYNCILDGNSAVSYEGGAGGGACDSSLNNCLVTANTSYGGAGGGSLGGTLNNCTVVGNTAAYPWPGGGVEYSTANDCIIYENNPNNIDTTSSANFCCATPLPAGIRNIATDPAFASNYQLQSNSPCINSGNNAYVTTTTDLGGNPRIVGGTVDIGAYEYQTPTSVISYAYLQEYGLPTDGSVDFADLDGTAFNVYQDWIAGLNPTNPASVLAMLTPVTTNTATGVTVTWQSVSGVPYLLQRSTNLTSQPPFSTIQNNITGQSGTTSYTDTSATNNVPYFYRVGVLAP